jgi:hypothetical protein
MKGSAELRAELERLTKPAGGAAAVRLDEQISEIAALSTKYPHSIVLNERASVARQRTNCVMYALGIEAETVEDWCNGSVHPGLDFMAWLVKEKLTAKTGEPSDGDIVVYLRDDQRPLHAGVAKDGQIISKWGSGGTHVWRHGVFEIPSSYGSDARVYERISPEQAILAFREWAKPRL